MPYNRQREMRPSLLLDGTFLSLDPFDQCVFLKLGWYSDDQGREAVNGALMKGLMFPAQPTVLDSTLDDSVLRISERGLLDVYAASHLTLFQIVRWSKWWRVDKPAPSEYPPPPVANDSRTVPDPFPVEERGGEESEWGEGAPSRSDPDRPPSPFCRNHQPAGTEAPCRQCGTARLAHEQWVRTQMQDEAARLRTPVFEDLG